jgi:hypothetical protein
MSQNRIIVATFCDDIRYETGNKHSLIGCYKQDLIIEKLPGTLPKLCAAVMIRTPIDQPLEKLVIFAKLDAELVGEVEFQEDQLQKLKREMVARGLEGMKTVEVNCHFTFSPLVIPQEGNLTIEVLADGEALNREVLKIRGKDQGIAPINSSGD